MYNDDQHRDEELWALIRKDDKNAFELLYRRYMQVLYAAIYKFTDEQAAAEDILQEVFLTLWEKRRDIDIQKKIFPYLYSITRFKVADHLRKKQLSGKLLAAWDAIVEEPAAPAGLLAGEDPGEQCGEVIAAEVEHFPDQLKRVYTLSFEQGKSIREVAEQLAVSPNTVKNHLQKIRRRLREAAVQITSFLVSLLWFFLR